ncbi:hypothetical protein F1188_17460 [Roseospira marina]|uniref:LPS-assembly lipoprotein n=1 Tax=Roseospira marina TaxID=140057 RepID=A0A5M6I8T9_9PROT|nr:LPS assembly lipoprotein LptE [Roseospira marina]KAA5604169.1 hypothetical protein F1188_17460 [Roseospira marina]MBB4315733.1 LPS-assembly lipoprotein [Roseospira marina]MBB5088900.1 LPS-assembly lipoprotein [Roseospira marina]
MSRVLHRSGRRALLTASGRALAGAAAFGAAGVLAACGFRPVHGDRGVGGGALTSVAVAIIPERMGQQLRNALLRRLQPGPEPQYEVQASVSLVDQDLGIQRDDRATLGAVHATAIWRLLARVGDGRLRLEAEGVARAAVTYNILENQYATEANRRKAQADMAESLASDIEARLIAYFARR